MHRASLVVGHGHASSLALAGKGTDARPASAWTLQLHVDAVRMQWDLLGPGCGSPGHCGKACAFPGSRRQGGAPLALVWG